MKFWVVILIVYINKDYWALSLDIEHFTVLYTTGELIFF